MPDLSGTGKIGLAYLSKLRSRKHEIMGANSMSSLQLASTGEIYSLSPLWG